jgi:hypothetical protein
MDKLTIWSERKRVFSLSEMEARSFLARDPKNSDKWSFFGE